MSVRFLDSDNRLPADRRAELELGFGTLMNAEYNEAFGILEACAADHDPLVRAFTFLYLGDLYHFQWDFKLSMQSYRKAVELFTEASHDPGRIMTSMRIADIELDAAATTDVTDDALASARTAARDSLEATIAEAGRIGHEFLRGFGFHYRALFLVEEAHFAEAVVEAEHALSLRERIGDDSYAPSSMALLARAKIEVGDFDGAVALAERAFQLQMDRNIRGGALRTLTILAYINEVHSTRRMEDLTSQFTAVEPIARTPFLVSGHTREELAVVGHAIEGPTPLMAAYGAVGAKRAELVSDSGMMVMLLQS